MIGKIFPFLRKDTGNVNDETEKEEEMKSILEQLKFIVSHKNWVGCYRLSIKIIALHV